MSAGVRALTICAAWLLAVIAAAAQTCTLPINIIAKDQTLLASAAASALVVAKPKSASVVGLSAAAPARVLLLIDGSGSMGDGRWQSAQAQAEAVLRAAPVRVAVGLAAFQDKPSWVADYTAPAVNLQPALAEFFATRSPRGGTALFDGIASGLSRPGGLRPGDAIVALSDGEDNSSHLRLDQAVDGLQHRGVRLFLLGFAPEARGIALDGKKLVAESGGAMRDAQPRPDAHSAAMDAQWLWGLLEAQNMATIRYAGAADADLKLQPAVQSDLGGILYPRTLFGCVTNSSGRKPPPQTDATGLWGVDGGVRSGASMPGQDWSLGVHLITLGYTARGSFDRVGGKNTGSVEAGYAMPFPICSHLACSGLMLLPEAAYGYHFGGGYNGYIAFGAGAAWALGQRQFWTPTPYIEYRRRILFATAQHGDNQILFGVLFSFSYWD